MVDKTVGTMNGSQHHGTDGVFEPEVLVHHQREAETANHLQHGREERINECILNHLPEHRIAGIRDEVRQADKASRPGNGTIFETEPDAVDERISHQQQQEGHWRNDHQPTKTHPRVQSSDEARYPPRRGNVDSGGPEWLSTPSGWLEDLGQLRLRVGDDLFGGFPPQALANISTTTYLATLSPCCRLNRCRPARQNARSPTIRDTADCAVPLSTAGHCRTCAETARSS